MRQKEEYVYHVDEKDRVIGKVTRREMRAKNLSHRSSDALIFNSMGDILVHKRTISKDVFPGYYSLLIGGALSYGESYDECMHRELSEEIGIKQSKLRRLFKYKYNGKNNKAFVQVYQVKYDGPFTLQKEEIEWAEFMPLSRLNQFMKKEKFCPDDIEIFNKYLKEFRD